MVGSITAGALYEAQRERLSLQWVAGRAGRQVVRDPALPADPAAPASPAAVGLLDLVHPHPIQVLGGAELSYLAGLGKNSRRDAVARLFGGSAAMIIVCGGAAVPEDIERAAQDADAPLLCSPLSSEELVLRLGEYLGPVATAHVTLHGVMMEVAGIGVLLTGDSGIGKSELALELISRGHRLIADDAPELHRVAPDTLKGACPPALRDFLEVRGLGVLNIRAMFGDRAIKHDKNLRLIVHLQAMDEVELRGLDRLHGSRQSREIQGVTVPQVTLPVVPGLNLAVLVECAVRNHILHMEGYNADLDFIERHQHYLASDKS